jgi:hypothetical protein
MSQAVGRKRPILCRVVRGDATGIMHHPGRPERWREKKDLLGQSAQKPNNQGNETMTSRVWFPLASHVQLPNQSRRSGFLFPLALLSASSHALM